MSKHIKNKGGRPRVTDARYREHVVSTRLDAVEHLRLEELKLRSGKSAADIVRELITHGYVRERMRRAHLDLMAQLKGIARNLNQLTRLANAVGFGAAIAQKLQPLVAEITELLYTFSGSKIDQRFSYSKLDAHFNQVQKQDAPKYSQQAQDGLKSAVGGFMSAFAKCFLTAGKGGGAGGGEIDLSAFGAGSLPLPPVDLGIDITAAQLQRQPDETPEQHIARITALINSVTAVMIAHAEEQKRKQQQVKKPQIKMS